MINLFKMTAAGECAAMEADNHLKNRALRGDDSPKYCVDVTKCQKVVVACAVFLMGLTAIAQQSGVSNVRVQPTEEYLIIMYDLAEKADIEVFISFDGGASFSGPLRHVSGAVGKGITAEKDKMLMWHALAEIGQVDLDNVVIKVVATASETGAPAVAAKRSSADVPLMVIGRKVYLWDREMDQDEFNG